MIPIAVVEPSSLISRLDQGGVPPTVTRSVWPSCATGGLIETTNAAGDGNESEPPATNAPSRPNTTADAFEELCVAVLPC